MRAGVSDFMFWRRKTVWSLSFVGPGYLRRFVPSTRGPEWTNLRTAARAKGMAQIAEETGLSRTSLYKSLRSESKPRFDTIAKVTKAFGLKLMPV